MEAFKKAFDSFREFINENRTGDKKYLSASVEELGIDVGEKLSQHLELQKLEDPQKHKAVVVSMITKLSNIYNEVFDPGIEPEDFSRRLQIAPECNNWIP